MATAGLTSASCDAMTSGEGPGIYPIPALMVIRGGQVRASIAERQAAACPARA